MSSTDVWMTSDELEATISRMGQDLAHRLDTLGVAKPLMIGIHTGGVWVAERLHAQLQLADPLGQLDISFYRDDFTRIGLHPQVRPSHLPLPVDERDIVLVDDVLHTGRTIRAALNVLFDYGRPARVLLATLVERDGRELPIAADVVGVKTHLEPGGQIKLIGPQPLALVRGELPRRDKRTPKTVPSP